MTSLFASVSVPAMVQYNKTDDVLGTVNRGNAAESGLCTLCRADCTGKCETWLSSMVGRKMLYPRDFGTVTAGSRNVTHVGVSYNSLRIQGYAYGVSGLSDNLTNNPDDCIFPNVSLETEFGHEVKTKIRMPLMTGALGSTFVAEKYWDSFAVGGALAGIPVVIGENVVGVDRKSKINPGETRKGKIEMCKHEQKSQKCVLKTDIYVHHVYRDQYHDRRYHSCKQD